MSKAISIVAVASVILLLATACTQTRPVSQSSDADSRKLQRKIEADKPPQFGHNDARSRLLWDWTRQVYATRQFRPVWTSGGSIEPAADRALRTLENASAEGLNPDDFVAATLRGMREATGKSAQYSDKTDFDFRLTYSLVLYTAQLCAGRVAAKDIDSKGQTAPRECDVPGIVSNAIDQNRIESIAGRLAPPMPEYRALKDVLKRYRGVAAQGGWQPLQPETSKEKPNTKTKARANASPKTGVLHGYPPALAANLRLTGDLRASANETGGVPDEAISEAVGRFQARHGLDPDGMLGAKTVRAMNVPVQNRIDQIEINLDRLRWTNQFEPRHIRVNVPGFELTVHDGNETPLASRIIVGADDNRTPIISGEMQSIVFSPYWNIPLSIATKELLPKIRKDPRYLDRQGIEVIPLRGGKVGAINPSSIDWDQTEKLDYQLRQRPGARNALGLVKFIFPNPFNIYLHDTPSENLFERLTRTLSHGCVRVEKAAELAAYVLQDQPEWTSERIKAAMHAGGEKHVNLKMPLPVHILYWTAWADGNGVVQFRDDVYGYDAKHKSLASPAPHPPDIHVHEIGSGVVADSAGLHR